VPAVAKGGESVGGADMSTLFLGGAGGGGGRPAGHPPGDVAPLQRRGHSQRHRLSGYSPMTLKPV